jgi:hypothetical protein
LRWRSTLLNQQGNPPRRLSKTALRRFVNAQYLGVYRQLPYDLCLSKAARFLFRRNRGHLRVSLVGIRAIRERSALLTLSESGK